jgi:hypothetical protein
MRKTDIYIAARRISRAIEESGLSKLFDTLLDPDHKLPEPTEVIEAFRRYTVATHDFGPNEEKMLRVFQLSSLSDSEFWASVISKGSEKRKELIRSIAENWHLYSDMIPKFIDLITPERNIFSDLEGGAEKDGSICVAVVLLESPEMDSPPERIAELMRSVRLMHDALAQIYELKRGDLTVTFCDSGSTKEFIFATSKEVARHLRELFKAAIELFLFHKERKLEKRIAIVAKSLPVLEAISAKKVALGAENARLLERAIMDGISSFLETGAVTRGFESDPNLPKALVQPTRKLITYRKSRGKGSK